MARSNGIMNGDSALTGDSVENDLLHNVQWGKSAKIWLAGLGVALLVCLFFYGRQLFYGLEVTGLNDYVSWGLYIVDFIFFVTVSLIGMLISSVLGLLNIKWSTPVARTAEIIALAFAMMAGLTVILDMGRPDRFWHLFVYGRIQSPILWDVAVVTTYVFLSLLLLYLPLIPDLSLLQKKGSALPRLQQKIYKALSLGWADKPEQYALIKKLLKVLLVAVIPVALAIHTVTSWLFAMTLRDGWQSTIYGPYFVTGAFVAGVAAVIIALYLFRRFYGWQDYFQERHFDKLGKLLVLVSLVYLYININELIVPAYKPGTPEGNHALNMLTGSFAPYFWTIQIVSLLGPLVLLLIPKMRRPTPIFIIALFVFVGGWFKRYLVVVPTQLHPNFPIQNVPRSFETYVPTVTEIAVTLLPFVLVLLIITILVKTVPIVSIWEYKEDLKEDLKEEVKEEVKSESGPNNKLEDHSSE